MRRATPIVTEHTRGQAHPALPVFHTEAPALYRAAYRRNAPFAKPGSYHTPLSPGAERQFRSWVARSGAPFDPNAKIVDYDMRGYWKATGGVGWRRGQHFPDTYKTPYDTTFSRESKYATAHNPFVWVGNNLVDRRSGQKVFTARTGSGVVAAMKKNG